jgi:CHRD domain
MKTTLKIILLLAFNTFAMAQTYSVTSVINGANEVPANASAGTATLTGTYDASTKFITVSVTYAGLTGTLTASHLHQAAVGVNGGVIVNLGPATGANAGTFGGIFSIPPANEASLLSGNVYINLHSTAFPGGELRGQLALLLKPKCEIEAAAGDLCIKSSLSGVILKSPNGSCYRIQVADNGSLTTTLVSCF